MKLTGENRSTRGKTCSSATLSSTNPTWTGPASKPGLRGGRPATKLKTLTSRPVVFCVLLKRDVLWNGQKLHLRGPLTDLFYANRKFRHVTYLAWHGITHSENDSEWPLGFVWTVGPQPVYAPGYTETSSTTDEYTCNKFRSELQRTEDFVCLDVISIPLFRKQWDLFTFPE
jgi:hypothetical protein